MPRSILTAIEEGCWDYEPNDVSQEEYHSTEALPGSEEKLKLLAQRVCEGLPLWHPADRQSVDDDETAFD
jgi:hypothetical protein